MDRGLSRATQEIADLEVGGEVGGPIQWAHAMLLVLSVEFTFAAMKIAAWVTALQCYATGVMTDNDGRSAQHRKATKGESKT
jgi:hypothetical protein